MLCRCSQGSNACMPFSNTFSPVTLLAHNFQLSEQNSYMSVGGLWPVKLKQFWVIQEKIYWFILSFWFQPQVSWRTFVFFWVLWAANMVKLLILFHNLSHWVNYPTKIILQKCLSSLELSCLNPWCHLWKCLQMGANDGSGRCHRPVYILQCGFDFICVFLWYTPVTCSCLRIPK